MKFRVWHKMAKKFVNSPVYQEGTEWKGDNYSDSIFALDASGYLCYDDYGNGMYGVEDSFNYEVNLFTGMIDSSGKEIYENDIVKYSRKYGREDLSEIVRWKRFELKHEYTFFETWAIGEYTLLSVLEYAGIEYKDDYNSLRDIKPKSLEVIGNIYESN